MSWNFRTVPDELVACAEALAEHYRGLGYIISIEPTELAFPNTPTLQAERGNTRIVVEVVDRLNDRVLRRWAAYGKSSGRDFRVVVGVGTSFQLVGTEEAIVRELGIGCLIVGDGGVIERIPATDLALNVELPTLAEMPAKIRGLLGPSYEKFTKGDWREGFEEACQAFENEARRYLKRHSKTGRIKVLKNHKPTTLSSSAIDRMTMGGLSTAFGNIISRNLSDSRVGDTLAAVNRDRIAVVHKKATKRAETSLRTNVGSHMWTLYNGFRDAIK